MKLSIVIPVYNEEKTIEEIVSQVLATGWEVERELPHMIRVYNGPEFLAQRLPE